MESTNETPTIINAIMDMDFNDKMAVKSVMDEIVSHPFIACFLIGSLAGTKQHRHAQLHKSTFFYQDPWTFHDLDGLVFGIDEGPNFLVNIFEVVSNPRHEIPFDRYGNKINGEFVKEQDIPVPPLQDKNIEKFVRIDVFVDRSYKTRTMTMSENSTVSTADGIFHTIPNVDINEVIASLHRRTEGYKVVTDRLIYSNENGEMPLPYVDPNDTFENKILNLMLDANAYFSYTGDLSTLAQGLLTGLKVYQLYQGSDDHILAVESPMDGTLFMLIFDHTVDNTIDIPNFISQSNMRKLLAHYIPEFISNRRRTILMAVTYSITPLDESGIALAGNITGLMHFSESSEVKKAVEIYTKKVTLQHMCRRVIVKNMCMLGDKIVELPSTIQRFIYSSKSPIELIDYCMDAA